MSEEIVGTNPHFTGSPGWPLWFQLLQTPKTLPDATHNMATYLLMHFKFCFPPDRRSWDIYGLPQALSVHTTDMNVCSLARTWKGHRRQGRNDGPTWPHLKVGSHFVTRSSKFVSVHRTAPWPHFNLFLEFPHPTESDLCFEHTLISTLIR